MSQPYSVYIFIASCTLGFLIPCTIAPNPPQSSPASIPGPPYKFSQDTTITWGDEKLGTSSASANIGDKLSISYSVTAKIKKKVICQDQLLATSVRFDPEGSAFDSSEFTLNNGAIDKDVLPSNPLDFVPSSMGTISVLVTGWGCKEQHPDPWQFTTRIDVAGATAKLDQAETRGPTKPSFFTKPKRAIQWAGQQYKSGQEIGFQVQNNMKRKASFNSVQIVKSFSLFVTIDGVRVPFKQQQGGMPTLDEPPYDRGQIAPREDAKTIKSRQKALIKNRDAPTSPIPPANAWRSPNKEGTFSSVGFTYSFQNFILQDWDKPNNAKVAPVPIGDVVEWGIEAEANLQDIGNGRCKVTRLSGRQAPPPRVQATAPDFLPTYQHSVLDNLEGSDPFTTRYLIFKDHDPSGGTLVPEDERLPFSLNQMNKAMPM